MKLALFLVLLIDFVSVILGRLFNQAHYKFSGNYIGVYTEDTVQTYTFWEANSYCNDTFGTTLATWTNSGDQSDASNAVYSASAVPAAGKWAWSGVYTPDSGTTFLFVDGTVADSSNTDFSSTSTSECTQFDDKSSCGATTISSQNCGLNSRAFVCNAPDLYDGKPLNFWKNETICQASAYYTHDFDESGSFFGPVGVGYYMYYGCPGFSNDAILSGKIEAMEGYNCMLVFDDGSGSNTINVVAQSGETVYINGSTPGMIGGISIIEVYWNQTYESTFVPTVAPTSLGVRW